MRYKSLKIHPLERYMKNMFINKKQLAKRCEVSVYVINKVIKGKSVMSDNIYKICVETGLRADDLLNLPNYIRNKHCIFFD